MVKKDLFEHPMSRQIDFISVHLMAKRAKVFFSGRMVLHLFPFYVFLAHANNDDQKLIARMMMMMMMMEPRKELFVVDG